MAVAAIYCPLKRKRLVLHAFRRSCHSLADRGQLIGTAGNPLEQECAQFLLQSVQAPKDGGVINSKGLRGAHKIAAAAMKAFKADGITIQQFNEPAGGQVVFHLHMHVLPRHDGVAMLPPASRKEDNKVLEENAAKLIAALKG